MSAIIGHDRNNIPVYDGDSISYLGKSRFIHSGDELPKDCVLHWRADDNRQADTAESLLREIVSKEIVTDNGLGVRCCVFCGESRMRHGKPAGVGEISHTDDCPISRTRKLLGVEVKP